MKIILAVSFIILSFAKAAEDVAVFSFDDPTFFGSGCPEGSVEVVPASDGQTVSVLFSQYIAETSSEKSRSRFSCNLAIPVDVKSGYSIGIYQVDYRGYADVPDVTGREKATFNAEYFFAGIKGPTQRKTFNPGYSDEFYLSDDVMVASVVYSECGASTIFRINTSIMAQKDDKEDESDVYIGIDTIDTTITQSMNMGFQYYITEQECGGESSSTSNSLKISPSAETGVSAMGGIQYAIESMYESSTNCSNLQCTEAIIINDFNELSSPVIFDVVIANGNYWYGEARDEMGSANFIVQNGVIFGSVNVRNYVFQFNNDAEEKTYVIVTLQSSFPEN